MSQLKTPEHKKALPTISKVVAERLAILLSEIQLAITWSRPSILLAVHNSAVTQGQASAALETLLTEAAAEVAHLTPNLSQPDLVKLVMQAAQSNQKVFFIHGLGTHPEVYAGLNLHRETIVENRLKLIFWLTPAECTAISHQAPDFWAFRHRVIEFPAAHNTRKQLPPAGALLWHDPYTFLDLEALTQKITEQEHHIQSLPNNAEAIIHHVNATNKLAYLYWLTGENQKAEDLLQQVLKRTERLQLDDLQSIVLNGLAISYYDRGAYHEALTTLQAALAKNPADGLLWANYGIVCKAAGQSKKSPGSIKKAIRLNPGSADFLGVPGYLYLSMGKFETALPLFEKALSMQPANHPFRLAAAVCLTQLGDAKRSDDHLKLLPAESLATDPILNLCYEYMQGNKAASLQLLSDMVHTQKIPQVFLKRDPNLRFVFGADVLASLP